MTSTITRTPLQALSMTSTQRPEKRRSARLAFGEEDAQPAKKPKVEGRGPGKTKQANGRTNGASNKKTKQSYEEEEDGFQFSRTRSRKAQAKPQPPEPVTNGEKPVAPAPTRKRKSSVAASTDAQSAPKPRRSVRLSGDKEQIHPAESTQPKENGIQKPDEGKSAELAGISELKIDKKRNPTKIPLPFADTPRIERNKEMRKASAQSGSRRSSLGNRGRRASSLIDSGTSEGGHSPPDLRRRPEADLSLEAMPHEEVDTAEFYKHIAQDLPEPRRMKHLLMWCARRALPEKPFGEAKDAMAASAGEPKKMPRFPVRTDELARAIQEELLKDFQNKSDMSDWFNREEAEPTVLVKKPNPRNIQNAAKLQELEQEVKRLKEEKRAWDDLLKSTPCLAPISAQQAPQQTQPSSESGHELVPPLDSSRIDTSLLDPTQAAILTSLSSLTEPPSSSSSLVSTTQSRLRAITDNIQFSVDRFADGVHKLEVFREQAERVADRILGVAANKLEERSSGRSRRRSRSRSRSRSRTRGEGDGGGDVKGGRREDVDIRDVLRGLSRVIPR